MFFAQGVSLVREKPVSMWWVFNSMMRTACCDTSVLDISMGKGPHEHEEPGCEVAEVKPKRWLGCLEELRSETSPQ